MITTENSISQINADWQNMCQLYPFYAALNERFNLGAGLCDELEEENQNPTLQHITVAQRWFAAIDAKATAFNMRELMHSNAPLSEDKLRLLLLRHIHQIEKTEQLREKLEFLLVQYFAQVFGPNTHLEEISFSHVAEALRLVLGPVAYQKFPWAEELQKLSAELLTYNSLKDLLAGGLLDRGRAVKRSIGPEYFQPAALVAVTKFNFALRAGFFRLMHFDIQAIGKAVYQLRAAGVKTVDASRAELSASEAIDSIQNISHEWRRRLRSDYQLGNSFKQLVLIREACEESLQKIAQKPAEVEKPKPFPPPKPKVEEKAAAAAATPAKAKPPEVEKPKPFAPSKPKVEEKAPAVAAATPAKAKPAEVEKPKPSPPPKPKAEEKTAAATPAPAKVKPAAPAEKTPAKAPVKPVVAAGPAPDPKPAAAPAPAPVPVEAKPKEVPPQVAQKPAVPPVAGMLEDCLEQITGQLQSKKNAAAATVVVGEIKLMLATWEVAAFVHGRNGTSEVLRRAVAARSLLALAVDSRKKQRAFDLPGALVAAQGEAGKLEEELRQARERQDVDTAVNLAATGKRLATLITQVEGLAK